MKNKKIKVFAILLCLFLLTGCSKILKDGKEVVKNPETNENEIKVTYTYRDLSYDEYGNEIWQDATREDVINPKDAQNYIYYSDTAGCTLNEKNK